MFILTTVVDTIRIPAHMLSLPSLAAVHDEMDRRYPNRVLMDVGLVVSRYGDCLRIGDGSCVNGDGGAHHECLVKLVIFRPFVDEVCTGRIIKSTPDGIQVSLGFFQDIFIPPYWMLRPSKFNKESGLWVWTPDYDEDNEKEDEVTPKTEDGDSSPGDEPEPASTNEPEAEPDPASANKSELASTDNSEPALTNDNPNPASTDKPDPALSEESKKTDESSYVMELGDQIRFKVKSINFTQVTKTAKGMQATTTTTAQAAHPNMMGGPAGNGPDGANASLRKGSGDLTEAPPVRKRSLSVDLTESQNVPASMHVVASICEDGLGLTSWWEAQEEDDEDDEGEEETEE